MEVTVAKSAGFCFGVKRAVDTVYREIESGEKPVYTFGPIIRLTSRLWRISKTAACR